MATAVGLQVGGSRHAVPPVSWFQLMIGPRGIRETVAFYWRPLLLVVVLVVVAVVLVARWVVG